MTTETTKTTITATITGNGLAPYGIGEIIEEVAALNPAALYEKLDETLGELGSGVHVEVTDKDGEKMTLAEYQDIYPA